MPKPSAITDSEKSVKAYRDGDSYEVVLPSGKVIAREGPFPDIDALIRHFQTFHPGIWLTTKPKP